MDLKLATREREGIVILDLRGRITLGDECATLQKAVADLLSEKHVRIVLNLGDVVRVDSSGIGTLVQSVILTAQAGGRLKLLKIPRLLHNSLVIHRLLQAFEIFSAEEDALASFQPPDQSSSATS